MLGRWHLILRYLPPYRAAVAGGVAALLTANACMVVVPLFIREGVRTIERGLAENGIGVVAFYAAAAFATAVLGALASFYKRNLLMRTSRRLETDLRRDLFRHIQHLPLSFFDRTRTGDLMSRATADIETARMAIGPAAMYLTDAILRFFLCLAVMLSVHPVLTLYLLVPLGGISAGLFRFAPRIHRASRTVQDQLAAISARTQESFAGGRVVKIFAIERREEETLDALGREYLAANLHLARVRGLTQAWLILMSGLGLGLILLVGGNDVIKGRFDLGGMLLFSAYLTILVWPMMAVGWVLTMVQRGAAGIDRIAEVMSVPEETSGEGASPALRGEIEFRDLTFAYESEPVLRGVTVKVPVGSTLGIVGRTGSGKSTLVSLLARLYDPPRGSLFLDGEEIGSLPLARLREAIAFVPQEAFLYSTSIRANIAFGAPGADDARLQRAADDAHLRRDLDDFPDGIETIVGERGVNLSGGQKQRAALARALASDAPILVLDDALSAVDSETEAAILANLNRIGEQRTMVVVAHRISAVRNADRIIYLSEGRVAEEGTHAELIALRGAYARLAHAQEIEAEIEAME